MNYGPLVFLAAFFALAGSWFGFILTPQIQLGRERQATNSVNTAELYPQMRPGAARQGMEVYRANGCAACHSQQVRQTGTACNVLLTDLGTNAAAVFEACTQAKFDITKSVPSLAASLPRTVAKELKVDQAVAAAKVLTTAGAKAEVEIVALGPDIRWGWGKRRTVAADFLYDETVMPGSQRVGPDLANVGLRLPDENWQLVHLYAPKTEVKDSPMPAYKFLFEKRKLAPGQAPSPVALQFPKDAPGLEGFEIVPKPEARMLVAYLLSLHANTPLFETPMSAPPVPAATAATNSPAK